jgi:NTE family protein
VTTAFVFSGGGSLGATQVGMVMALAEHGVTPDYVVGASIGAINAAWVAGRPGLDGARTLADIWRDVQRRDVFPSSPLTGIGGFLGRRNYLVPPHALRRLVERHLEFRNLEDAPIPIGVVSTDVNSGTETLLTKGSTIDALIASASIPGVFPPVMIDGRPHVDGGVINNAPISHAVQWGATTVYVLPTGYSCALKQDVKSALGVALQALNLLVQRRLGEDIANYQSRIDLRVVPPLCPISVSPVDFSHTTELIERAHSSCQAWLKSSDPRPEDQSLAFRAHRHHDAGGSSATTTT